MERKTIQISKNLHKHLLIESKQQGLSIKKLIERLFVKGCRNEQNALDNKINPSKFKPDGIYTPELYLWTQFKHILKGGSEKPKSFYSSLMNNPLLMAQNYLGDKKSFFEDATYIAYHFAYIAKFKFDEKISLNGEDFCYIGLMNEDNKNIYKIGRSKEPHERMKGLNIKPLFVFSNSLLESYLLSFYSDRIATLLHDFDVCNESVYLQKNDIDDISRYLKEYQTYSNTQLLKEILYTEHGFYLSEVEDTIENIYMSYQKKDDKKSVYTSLIDLIAIKVLGCKWSKYALDNKLNPNTPMREQLSEKQVLHIDKTEKDLNGYIKYAGIVVYEQLSEKLDSNEIPVREQLNKTQIEDITQREIDLHGFIKYGGLTEYNELRSKLTGE